MNKIWIIGASTMAVEYTKVLKALDRDFCVIGRGLTNAAKFEQKTGITPITGGLDAFLDTKPEKPSHVIVAVGVEQLCPTANSLLKYGIKNILLEKPGALTVDELELTEKLAFSNRANVFIAYNRRFYSSVLKAEEIIKEDGGVTSFNFEFTEWAHTIKPDHRPIALFNHWLIANSTHVIDTAFFLGGEPREMVCYVGGKNEIDWHPSGNKYCGAGITSNGALFSYQANWSAPGRWVIEILTKSHRLYFKPMESLLIQNLGSVIVEPVQLEDNFDKQYKPGFYLQTKNFLDGETQRMCSIKEQINHLRTIYNRINGNC